MVVNVPISSEHVDAAGTEYVFQASFQQRAVDTVSDGTDNLVPAGHVIAWYQKSFKTNKQTTAPVPESIKATLKVAADPELGCTVTGVSARGGFDQFAFVRPCLRFQLHHYYTTTALLFYFFNTMLPAAYYYYTTTILLYYYTNIPLYYHYYTTILLYHYYHATTTILLYNCETITISLY